MTLAGRGLSIGYSDRVVGRGLDVGLAQNEVLALLGPNGSGKTTLLKTLLGILPPLAGAALIEGKPISSYSAPQRARRIAYVPQAHVPTFAFTVETVVLMGRTAHGSLLRAPSAADRLVAGGGLPPLDWGGRVLPPPHQKDLRANGRAATTKP